MIDLSQKINRYFGGLHLSRVAKTCDKRIVLSFCTWCPLAVLTVVCRFHSLFLFPFGGIDAA